MSTENEQGSWTIQKLIAWTTTHFESKGISSARLDSELLLAKVLGCRRLDLYLKFSQVLADDQLKAFKQLVIKRSNKEPVAYILGEQEFYGRPFKVGPGVLIPRPETEHIIDEVLEWVRRGENLKTEVQEEIQSDSHSPENLSRVEEVLLNAYAEDTEDPDSESDLDAKKALAMHSVQKAALPNIKAVKAQQKSRIRESLKKDLIILDVGSGSGCIGITLALELLQAKVVCIDKSPAGVQKTLDNAKALGVSDRVEVICSSFEDYKPAHSFNIVVSNPPYIGLGVRNELQKDVRDFEPAEALFGGNQGHELIETWIPKFAEVLKDGGLLLFEMGFDQENQVVRMTAEEKSLSQIKAIKDFSGHSRILKAVKSKETGL